jgi:diguanylate cyclase (GGDEF)-like protein
MKKILIADDDPSSVRYIGELLKSGYEVYVAGDGVAALDLARRIRPDLMLLDVMMPGMDGFSLCSEIKKEDSLANIPVVFITARSEPDDIVRGFDVGGQDYIAKPFHPKELYARIRTHIELKSAQEIMKEDSRRLAEVNRDLAGALERMEIMARIDPLTGLANRRFLIERLGQEAARTRRHGKVMSIAIADIDNFKRINDTKGHECGDIVLQRIASVLSGGVRREDLLARWGGEEFLLVFPETTPENARGISEKLRSQVASTRIRYEEEDVHITITLGVAEYNPALEADANIRRADAALYKGKQSGKNRVCLDDGEEC